MPSAADAVLGPATGPDTRARSKRAAGARFSGAGAAVRGTRHAPSPCQPAAEGSQDRSSRGRHVATHGAPGLFDAGGPPGLRDARPPRRRRGARGAPAARPLAGAAPGRPARLGGAHAAGPVDGGAPDPRASHDGEQRAAAYALPHPRDRARRRAGRPRCDVGAGRSDPRRRAAVALHSTADHPRRGRQPAGLRVSRYAPARKQTLRVRQGCSSRSATTAEDWARPRRRGEGSPTCGGGRSAWAASCTSSPARRAPRCGSGCPGRCERRGRSLTRRA